MFSNITTEDFQKYARIVLYHIGAALTTSGYVTGSKWAVWSGPILSALTFLWTLYGNRLIAKLNEISKVPGTTIITQPTLADALPDNNKVVSNTEVKAVNK